MQQKQTVHKAYHSQTHKILRQGENHESIKGKKVLNLQGKTDQVCSRPKNRNLAGQKGVAEHVQCAELEKYVAKNSLSSKDVIQNRRIDKKFPKQTKIKGACDHETSPARNFKEDSLRGEKMKKKQKQKQKDQKQQKD